MTDSVWLLALLVVALLVIYLVRVRMSLRETIVVHRPVSDVFTFVSDPRNTPKWNLRISSVKLLDEEIGTGARYGLQVSNGPVHATLPYTVVAFDRNRTFAAETRTAGMVNRFQYSFETIGRDTSITASSEAKVPLIQALVIRVIGSSRTRQNLARMRSAIEGH